MTDVIESLTPEQEAQIPVFYSEYLEIGWSTEPADRPTAESVMREFYKQLEHKEPEFVWFDSPLAAQQTIEESTGEKAPLPVIDGSAEAHWLAFYMFCRTLKEDMYEPDKDRLLLLWDRLARSCGPIYPYENYCLMCERPKTALRDAENLLHCDDGPALEYPDGFAVYAVHGVRIPARLGTFLSHPWDLTLEQLEDGSLNEDVRTILQDRWCYEEVDSAGDRVGSGGGRYVQEIGAKQIHEDVYTGYKDVSLIRALLEGRDGRKWLACSDSSTDRVYYIQVPRHVTTCSEAHEAINGGIPDSKIVVSA